MRRIFLITLGFVLMSGCTVKIPNGVFICGTSGDCPSGYFCHSSDSRCHDTEEPPCTPVNGCTSGEPVGTFECGIIDDGCGNLVDCGDCAKPEDSCGGGGIPNFCGCEPQKCSEYNGGMGVECGFIPTGCNDGLGVDCGSCPGENDLCILNECVCQPTMSVDCTGKCGSIFDGCELIDCPEVCVDPDTCGGGGVPNECGNMGCTPSVTECDPGFECGFVDDGCGNPIACGDDEGDCPEGEVCDFDTHQCECVPINPCSEFGYECGEHDDGCGGTVDCGECDPLETCDTWQGEDFVCGGCECADFEYECGEVELCGETVSCGFCQIEGERCDETQQCVCEDIYESNESLETSSVVPSESENLGKVFLWRPDEATLHASGDIDWYELRVRIANNNLGANLFSGASDSYDLQVLYACPEGSEAVIECENGEDIEVELGDGRTAVGCTESGGSPFVSMSRACKTEGIGMGERIASVFVGVRAEDPEDFNGPCDSYDIAVFATDGDFGF